MTEKALSVSAHEIRLKNGDRLSGIVVSRDHDGVVLETQYAGRIRIAMEYIETIDMERPVTNISASGERPADTSETKNKDIKNSQGPPRRRRTNIE